MNEQSNTQFGPVQVIAGDALTGLEGYLVQISNDSGTPKAYLPDAVTDRCLYVVLEGAAAGSYASLQPLAHAQQARAELEGTVTVGARLRLYTPDGTNDGKVATIGSTAGVYFSPGVALEAGVDGQLVLFRPDPQLVTVAGSHIADPAATASDPAAAANDITDNGGGTDPEDHTIAVITANGTIAVTFTANDPSFSADGALTIADGSTPTVTELQEFCQELNAKNTALNTAIGAIKNAIALIAAEYNALKNDVEANNAAIDAAIDDIQANNSAIDSALAALETAKILATS